MGTNTKNALGIENITDITQVYYTCYCTLCLCSSKVCRKHFMEKYPLLSKDA